MRYFLDDIPKDARRPTPKSLVDPCDAYIISHYIVDTLHRVFGNYDDRAYFVHMTPDAKNPDYRTDDNSEFVEMFVTTHNLREYIQEGAQDRLFYGRFRIFKDKDGPVLWSGDHLESAVQMLLQLDAAHSIRESWVHFFNQYTGVS